MTDRSQWFGTRCGYAIILNRNNGRALESMPVPAHRDSHVTYYVAVAKTAPLIICVASSVTDLLAADEQSNRTR